MKKLQIIAPLSIMCLSLVGCNNNKGTGEARLWRAYTTENLISDWDYDDKENSENDQYRDRDSTLRFNCIKNENEGVQLMISAKEHINSFDFELPDVKGDRGIITKDHFSVAAAWYQDVGGTNEKYAYPGYYPDALIPLENYKFRRHNFIEKGRSQALYINLVTDKNTPAGTYKGTGVLTLDDKKYNVPFEVRVYDAEMPDECHQKSCYLIWYEEIQNGELKNSGPDMQMKYFDFVVSKRIAPGTLPSGYESNFDLYIDKYVERVIRDEKISASRAPFVGNQCTYPRVKSFLQKMIDKNLELRRAGDTTINLFEKLFFYVDDEPTAARYPEVKAHDKIIFDLKKELCEQLKDYPDLYESFTHIENLVTIQYTEELVATNEEGGVECWCPQFQYFQSAENREIYKQRMVSNDRDFGEHVWWYGCMDPQTPYPSYHLDADLLNSRLIKYMQYDYEIQGNIFWNVCYYSKYTRGFTTSRDIWHDPISWANCAGDGQLVYPGITYGIDGPITTLRMESILASNEEYEYQWLIEQKVNEYNTQKGTSYNVRELLQKYYKRLYKNVVAYDSDEEFDAVRLELLDVLETLNHDLEAGMAKLLAK